jgi:hypothetical protein
LKYIEDSVAEWFSTERAGFDRLAQVFLGRTQDILVGLIQHRLLESLGDDSLFILPSGTATTSGSPRFVLGPALKKKIIRPEITRYMKQDIGFTGSFRTRGEFIKLLRNQEDLLRCKMQKRRHEAGICVLGMDLRTINRMLNTSILKINSIHPHFLNATDVYKERSKIRAQIDGYMKLFTVLWELEKLNIKKTLKRNVDSAELDYTAAERVTEFAEANASEPTDVFLEKWYNQTQNLMKSVGGGYQVPEDLTDPNDAAKKSLLPLRNLQQQFSSQQRGKYPGDTSVASIRSGEDPQEIAKEIIGKIKEFPFFTNKLIETIPNNLPAPLNAKVKQLLDDNQEIKEIKAKYEKVNDPQFAEDNFGDSMMYNKDPKTMVKTLKVLKETLPYLHNQKIRELANLYADHEHINRYHINQLLKATKRKSKEQLFSVNKTITVDNFQWNPASIKLLADDKYRLLYAKLLFDEMNRRGKEIYEIVQRQLSTKERTLANFEKLKSEVDKFKNDFPEFASKSGD